MAPSFARCETFSYPAPASTPLGPAVLDCVSFTNFKSLKSVAIDLSPLTVLVGPNGSGKSSVLEGVALLSRTGIRPASTSTIWGRFNGIFSERRSPFRLVSSPGPTQLGLSIREANADTMSLTIAVPAPDDEDGRALRYTIRVEGPKGTHRASLPSSERRRRGEPDPLDHPRVRHFSSVVYLHLDATVLARTSTTDEEEPRMAPDGRGLASTLAWLAGAKPDVLREIADALSRVVPGVRRILLHRERITSEAMDQVLIDGQPIWRPVTRNQLGDRFSIEFDDGTEVPADLLSEGTVLALGLLTKLHEPERPRLLLLDDIDRGLHLGAQAKLVEVLRNLMKADPQLQILCTTHSAYLLDLFEPSEVRVLDLDESRATHAKPLTAHPEFDKWRFGTQTGELWAALGESWVIEPSPEDPSS